MADDAGERTETPTPRRRTESREKGQIAKSQDLNAAVTLLAGLIFLRLAGGWIWRSLQTLVRDFLGAEPVGAPTPEQMVPWMWVAGKTLASLIVPFMIGMFVFALIISLIQAGWLFTLEPLKPSLNRLNPLNGLKRIFSGRSVVTLLTNLGKLGAVVWVVYVTVAQNVGEILGVVNLHETLVWSKGAHLVFTVGIRILALMLVLAILDYIYQWYRHEKDLKMTKEEVKEEMRRMEGDPVMKRRRQQVQQQLAMQRIRTTVPQADVVVTNPTELAIAIKYDAEKMSAPRVLAKGRDYMAEQIRKIAIEHGIPIVERRPLAQALYRAVDVGQEIPAEFYRAVAEILAYVYQLKSRKPAMAT